MSNKFLKFSIFLLFSLFCFSGYSQSSIQLKRDRSYYYSKSYKPTQRQFYLRLGSGIATFYKSDHRYMQNFRIPISLQLELENNKMPFSVLLGGRFLTRFYLDDFTFSPTTATVNLKYSLAHLLQRPSKLDFYVIGGGGGWYAYLTDIEYAQVKAYENKSETDFGIGFSAGSGISYRLNDFDLNLQYLYFYGKAKFIAGYFTEQNFYIGSHQIMFLLSYKFWINKKQHACPSFKTSFHR